MSVGQTVVVKADRFHGHLRIPALLLAVVLVAAACSSDEKSDSTDGSSEAAEGEATIGAPEVPEECSAEEGDEATGSLAEVEERGRPDAAAAENVGDEPVDVIEGEGEVVIDGGSVEVHYTIFNPKDGSELESSWDLGEPVMIPIADVFTEFGTSMTGMLVGGRRAFVVPATSIAGDPPPPESGLTAEDDLVFVVDLVSVSEESGGGTVETDEDALAAAEERGAPDVAAPEGDEDTAELIWIDDVIGDGAVVCPGDTVVAHYTGVEAVSGEEFDSSWERGEPIEFGLDGVIQGWTEGLVGMKVGGRRTLVIPADQAYGEEPTGGQPGGVLVFTVDLVGAG